VGFAGYELTAAGDDPRSIALPESISGYSRAHDAAGARVEQQMRSYIGASASGPAAHYLDATSVGVYERDADVQQRLIALAGPVPDLSADERSVFVDDFDRQFGVLGGAPLPASAGPHGGEVHCSALSIGQIQEAACYWVDGRTYGLLL